MQKSSHIDKQEECRQNRENLSHLKKICRLHYTAACSFTKKELSLHIFFQGIFRIPVLWNKCFQVLKNYTVSKSSSPKTRKASECQTLACALQTECFEKKFKENAHVVVLPQ